jgi:hypothetical protein
MTADELAFAVGAALFDALDRLPSLPGSVAVAAGALACVASEATPATASGWIEKGYRAALLHQAPGFAHFFGQLVTRPCRTPSAR